MKFEALTENTLCLLQMQELYNNSVFVVYSLSCVQLCDPIDCQAPLSMGFPRQEYQSVLSFPSPGDLPDQPNLQICVSTIASRFSYCGGTLEVICALKWRAQ